MAKAFNFIIRQGKTFYAELRWETEPIVYKPITAMSQTAPIEMEVIGHGLTDGWRGAITNAKGMTELNAEANNVQDADYHEITVVDADNITINKINATGFKPYISGGVLQYNSPGPLTGADVRMTIRDKVGGVELMTLTAANSRVNVNTVAKRIELTITADDTAAILWKSGVYDIEVEDATGRVDLLQYGKVVVEKEITT